jgi:hypothetical protein
MGTVFGSKRITLLLQHTTMDISIDSTVISVSSIIKTY